VEKKSEKLELFKKILELYKELEMISDHSNLRKNDPKKKEQSVLIERIRQLVDEWKKEK
jgi:hypothetical protein